MKFLYDVCSDYTIDNDVSDKSKDQAKTTAYKWVKGTVQGIPVLKGVHISYDELHYIKCDTDINGLNAEMH